MATVADGFAYHPAPLVVGVVLGTLVMLLVGFISSLPFASVTRLVPRGDHPTCSAEPASPVLLGRVAKPVAVSDPHAGATVAARGGVRPGDPRAVAGDLRGGVSRYVRGGVVLGGQGTCSAATSSKGQGCCDGDVCDQAVAAFGRNDIRGTYRDPLLVMIVLAPVIWTVGVVRPRPAVHRDAGRALRLRPGSLLPAGAHRVAAADQHHHRRWAGRVPGPG